MLVSDDYYMNICLKLASKSHLSADVPIGALVISDNGNIIGKGYNNIEKKSNSLLHAEIIAINQAIKNIGYKHLLNCSIYTTLEPCPMCAGAIVLSRLKNVIFGAYDPKSGACGSVLNICENPLLNHQCKLKGGILEEQCSQLLKNFFKSLRNMNDA